MEQQNDKRQDQESQQVAASFLPTVLDQTGIADTSRRGEQASIDLPVAALHSDDWRERVRAIRALETWGTRAPVIVLTGALDDPDSSVRAAAVHALGLWGEQAPVERLLPSLRDEDWHVRETAVLALGNLGPRVPEKALVLALNDSDGMVREVARTVLHQRQNVVVSQVTPEEEAPSVEPAPVPERPAVYRVVMEDAEPLEAHADRPGHASYLDTLRSPERRRKRGLLAHWPLLVACATLLIVGINVTGWLAFSLVSRHSASSMVVAMPGPTMAPQQPFQVVYKYHDPTNFANRVTWSPDSTRIAWMRGDDSLVVQSVLPKVPSTQGAGSFVQHFPHLNAILAIAWSPSGQFIAVGGFSPTWAEMYILDATNGHVLNTLPVNPASNGNQNASTQNTSNSVESLSWSPDNQRIVAGILDGPVRIYSIFNNVPPVTVTTSIASSTDSNIAAWSPDGKYIADGRGLQAEVWDASTLKPVAQQSFLQYQGLINALAWSPDSKRIAIGEYSGSVGFTSQVWDPFTGVDAKFSGVFVGSWSADNTRIADAIENVVQVWDATSGKIVYVYGGDTHQISWAAWSPDGNFIASCDDAGNISVWQAA